MPERHYWDTCAWVDLFEERSAQVGPMRTLWSAVERGAIEVLFSAITLAEVLVKPAGESPPRPWPDPHALDATFEADGLVLIQVDRVIGERARSLRRRHNLATPDAIHLACATAHDVDYLVTRDDGMLRKLPQQFRQDGRPLTVASPADVLGGPLFQAR